MRRHITPVALLVLALLALTAMQAGAAAAPTNIKETNVLCYNPTSLAWERVVASRLYGYYTQTYTSGNTVKVYRNLASTSTDAPLLYVFEDNASDDQAACVIRQDGTGDILSCTDGATEVFDVADGGAVGITGSLTFTSTKTTTDGISINATTQTSGDALQITVTDATLNGGKYIHCYDGSTSDFTVAEGGAVTCAGALLCQDRFQSYMLQTKAETTASRTIALADYGCFIFFSYEGAVAVTLPANGALAGCWFMCISIGSDSCAVTYSAASADTLITTNDAQADSVTFGSGHRIGSMVLFVSTGTYWVAINVGPHTMTVNT